MNHTELPIIRLIHYYFQIQNNTFFALWQLLGEKTCFFATLHNKIVSLIADDFIMYAICPSTSTLK